MSQREIHEVSMLDRFPTPNTFIRFLYSIGLGFLMGRVVLLLTTTGRRTALPRTTPLQYEEHDGRYYVISARGTRSDWYRNVARDPRVSVRVGARSFQGFASCTTDPERITDLLEIRLERRPWLVGRILEADGLSRNPGREELEGYSRSLAMVEIRPLELRVSKTTELWSRRVMQHPAVTSLFLISWGRKPGSAHPAKHLDTLFKVSMFMGKPDYGNWVPQKLLLFFLLASIVSYLVTYSLNTRLLVGVLKTASLLFLGFFVYLGYAYWLLERDDKRMQRQFWNLLIDQLRWDGRGKALDIGTGNGPVAILLAKKHHESFVKGIDYWGEPWTYSRRRCERNAEIEGVSGRVSFERASAVDLPFSDGEFDAVLSNYVFHAIGVGDRTQLIAEALRVLRDGGAFAFQDLFNDEFYGEDFLDVVKSWGLSEVNFVESKEFVSVPAALRLKHMTGGSGILSGIK